MVVIVEGCSDGSLLVDADATTGVGFSPTTIADGDDESSCTTSASLRFRGGGGSIGYECVASKSG